MGKKAGEGGGGDSSSSKRATWALCTIFWVVIALVVAILLAALFKGKDPDVHTQAILVNSYHMSMDGNDNYAQINVSLNLEMLLYNPNRATFHYSVSTASLFHAGSAVGFRPIPAGHVAAQQALDFTLALSPSLITADVASPQLILATSVVIFGHVTVLGVFPHHSTSASNCSLAISLSNATLEGYHCIDNLSL